MLEEPLPSLLCSYTPRASPLLPGHVGRWGGHRGCSCCSGEELISTAPCPVLFREDRESFISLLSVEPVSGKTGWDCSSLSIHFSIIQPLCSSTCSLSSHSNLKFRNFINEVFNIFQPATSTGYHYNCFGAPHN